MRKKTESGALRGLLGAALLLMGASCAPRPAGMYLAGDVSDDIDGIETSLSVDPSVFVESARARILISITNASDRDIQIRFPDSRQIVLLVLDDMGNLEYTDDHTVAVPTYLQLGTLETWDHTIEWDGAVEIGGQRLPLPPGHYQLQAGLRRAGALYVNRTNLAEVEVARTGAD